MSGRAASPATRSACATHAPLPDGGERIILATDRRLGAYLPAWTPVPATSSGQLASATAPATDYEFTLIEMRMNSKARAKGRPRSRRRSSSTTTPRPLLWTITPAHRRICRTSRTIDDRAERSDVSTMAFSRAGRSCCSRSSQRHRGRQRACRCGHRSRTGRPSVSCCSQKVRRQRAADQTARRRSIGPCGWTTSTARTC